MDDELTPEQIEELEKKLFPAEKPEPKKQEGFYWGSDSAMSSSTSSTGSIAGSVTHYVIFFK